MDTLAKLFGGQARIKIMRLFLLNTDQVFTIDEITSRSRVLRAGARREITSLISLGFIKVKIITVAGSRGSKKKVSGYVLNKDFQYLKPIKDLLVDPNLLLHEDIVQKFKPVGKIKLMVVAGVFIGNVESRADILIVGDKLKRNIIQQIVKGLEVEIGKELDYIVLDTAEFIYRINMYDKLVLDVLDFPHSKIINTGQLSTYIAKN
ncbi:hypothetical protein IT400_02635 [Candidatus Nomurabacteria bacterium]|nr:hypothetical protein [Candidatus Nomurabacteria bacterium]